MQCFARASTACAKADGLNASACSWHHISRTEHVCSECVQHYKQSTEWQSRADAPADDEASRLLEHIVSAHLPYWVRCECGVWRPLPQHADASQLREVQACLESLQRHSSSTPEQVEMDRLPRTARVLQVPYVHVEVQRFSQPQTLVQEEVEHLLAARLVRGGR